MSPAGPPTAAALPAEGGAPTIDLARLGALPDLQTRVDRKYVVPDDVAARLADVQEGSAVLAVEGRTALAYASVYFDTPDLACYRAAATGRRRRFKVRTRAYLDTGVCLLEAKTAGGRGETVKRRAVHPFDARDRLDDAARAVLVGWLGPEVPELRPTLTTTYRRTTVVDLRTGQRVTLDRSVVAAVADGRSAPVCRGTLVETKTLGRPSATDRWLWAHGFRPVRISKYTVGLAVLTPGLPANRWHRAVEAARGLA